jgi:hypothetical protein
LAQKSSTAGSIFVFRPGRMVRSLSSTRPEGSHGGGRYGYFSDCSSGRPVLYRAASEQRILLPDPASWFQPEAAWPRK